MKVLVTSNCQTAGITVALKAIFPNYDINAFPYPESGDQSKIVILLNAVKDVDIWVVDKRGIALAKGLDVKVIPVPNFYFSSFHPDITYARDIKTQEFTTYNYNSYIGVWAYNNKLAITDAAKLFNLETFTKLGYLDQWNNSVIKIKNEFSDAGFFKT